jgi:hypothetical protein
MRSKVGILSPVPVASTHLPSPLDGGGVWLFWPLRMERGGGCIRDLCIRRLYLVAHS